MACPSMRWLCVLLLLIHIHSSQSVTPGSASETSGAILGTVQLGSVDLLARGLALLDDKSVEEVPFEEEAAEVVSES
eukprot:9219953-Pyramimonas_sp.AAC.1